MSWIQLRSGGKFDFENPEASIWTIPDIAWGLSNIHRFNGQTDKPITVAQHSINVSYLVPAPQALAALFHDAAEAFIGDITTPLKKMLGGKFALLEQSVEAEIFGKLNLNPYTKEIRHADLVCLATERLLLFNKVSDEPWDCLKGIVPLHDADYGNDWELFDTGGNSRPGASYYRFMQRYEELLNAKP